MHEDIELFVVNAHCRMIFKRNTHTHTHRPQVLMQRCTLWNGFDLQRIRAHWECDTLTQPTQCVSVHRYSEWENEKCRIMKVCIGVKPIHFSLICGIKKKRFEWLCIATSAIVFKAMHTRKSWCVIHTSTITSRTRDFAHELLDSVLRSNGFFVVVNHH